MRWILVCGAKVGKFLPLNYGSGLLILNLFVILPSKKAAARKLGTASFRR